MSSSQGPNSAERKGKVPPAPAKHFPTNDVSDALDDLLLHARATLKQLDAMRARQAASSNREGATGKSNRTGPAMRGLGGVRPQFWHPSCQAHLWTGVTHDFDGLFDSDDEDLESTDSEGSVDWDLLHGARSRPGRFRSPAAEAARAASAAKAAPLPKRGFSMPPPRPKAEQKPRGTPAGAVPGASGAGAKPAPNPQGGQKSQGPHRGHAAGFRFGAQLAKAAAATLAGPEAEVRAALEAAKTSGGSDAGRQALKRLLLRWHPDKAPQGESPEAKAAQAEATRVLRFILQERERLGL